MLVPVRPLRQPIPMLTSSGLPEIPRKKAAIEAAGGRFVPSVGKATDYLVAGEKTGEAKKKSAEKFGVKVIDEAALDELLVGEPS